MDHWGGKRVSGEEGKDKGERKNIKKI